MLNIFVMNQFFWQFFCHNNSIWQSIKNFAKVAVFLALISANFVFNNAIAAEKSILPESAPNQGFADIVENLLPTAVNISTTQEFSNNGTGFIISADGFIATNNHVIEDAEEITVSLSDGSKYKAKIVGADKKSDLAVIKINAGKNLTFAKFGDPAKSRIGDWIIVIGNPYGLGGSVSVGIVSARGRTINGESDHDFIQTDAAINRGNSGGPMFNLKGEVIGICTALFSPSGGNVGIGFATPINIATPIIKQLKEQGEVIRGWIGISVQDISDEMADSLGITKSKGALVTDVTAEGPADKAGIIASDVIVKVGTQEIVEMKLLPQIISQMPVGKNISLTLLRKGKAKVVIVKVGKSPK